MSKGTEPRRLFQIVLAGVVLYVLLDVVAQLLPPHYSPIRDAESDLAVGPYGYLMTINFLNRGVLSLVFLYSLLKTIRTTGSAPSFAHRFRRGTVLFGVWGVGAILLAIFPTDVPATPMSWHGAIHLLIAILAFIGGAFGALLLSLEFGRSRALLRAKTVSLSTAMLSVVFLAIAFGSITTRFGGLTERVFLSSVLFWVAYTSAYLARPDAVASQNAG